MYIKKLLFDKIFFLTFVIRMGTLAGLPRRERSSTKTRELLQNKVRVKAVDL